MSFGKKKKKGNVSGRLLMTNSNVMQRMRTRKKRTIVCTNVFSLVDIILYIKRRVVVELPFGRLLFHFGLLRGEVVFIYSSSAESLTATHPLAM
jgi:hypothetical protein